MNREQIVCFIYNNYVRCHWNALLTNMDRS